jgi:hypothetical protein
LCSHDLIDFSRELEADIFRSDAKLGVPSIPEDTQGSVLQLDALAAEPAPAKITQTATGIVVQSKAVAHLDRRDSSSSLDDRAIEFVSQHGVCLIGMFALEDLDIGATNAASGNLY